MTISDIAKLAGVSSAAVSRYLNGGPLSEQKRAVIQAVVEQTGYSPDTAAQTLRTGKVRQVGVIVPSISSQSAGSGRGRQSGHHYKRRAGLQSAVPLPPRAHGSLSAPCTAAGWNHSPAE